MEHGRRFGEVMMIDTSNNIVSIELDDTGDEIRIPTHLFTFHYELDDPVTLVLGRNSDVFQVLQGRQQADAQASENSFIDYPTAPKCKSCQFLPRMPKIESIIRDVKIDDFELGGRRDSNCFVTETDLQQILGNEYERFYNSALERLSTLDWQSCGKFFQNPELFVLECHRICRTWAIRSLRERKGCPCCNTRGSAKLNQLLSTKILCQVWYFEKNMIQDFPEFHHSCGAQMCKTCLGGSLAERECSLWKQKYNPFELELLQTISIIPQVKCQIWNRLRCTYKDYMSNKWPKRWEICSECQVLHIFRTNEYKWGFCSEQYNQLQYAEFEVEYPLHMEAIQDQLTVVVEEKTWLVCYDDFPITEAVVLECQHSFWTGDFVDFITFQVEGNAFHDGGIACPDCKKTIQGPLIQQHLNTEVFDKYNRKLIERMPGLIHWPKPQCSAPFFMDDLESRNIRCAVCSHRFCKLCREDGHEGDDCQREQQLRRIAVVKALNQEFCQCPGCKEVYTKDDACEHVKCRVPGCEVEFCFQCACLRSPTMAHAAHYHRPQCKFYAPKCEDDKMEDTCSEWQRLGRLWDPPPDLETIRQFV